MPSRIGIILFLHFLFFSNCKSPNDRIMEQFDSVNRSLEKANRIVNGNDYSILYSDIQLKQKKDPTLGARADSIYHSTKAVAGLIDRLKGELQEENGVGAFKTNNPVTVYLVQTPATDSLRKMMMALAALDSTLTFPESMRLDPNWTEKYFNNTPTSGAITILNKFESDCIKATIISLGAIDRRL